MKRPCAGDKLVADHDGRGVLQDFAGVGGELSAVARRVIECDMNATVQAAIALPPVTVRADQKEGAAV